MKKDTFFVAVAVLALVYALGFVGSHFVFGPAYTRHWYQGTRLLPICIRILVTISLTSVLARFREARWISVAFWLSCLGGVVVTAVSGGMVVDPHVLAFCYLALPGVQSFALAGMLFVRGKPIRPYFLALFAADLSYLAAYWSWIFWIIEGWHSFPYGFVYILGVLPNLVLLALFMKVSRLPHTDDLQQEIDSIGAT